MRPNLSHPSRRGQVAGPQDEETCSAVIPPARRRPARWTRRQERQRKADAARDQQRAERIIPHAFCDRLRAGVETLAAVLIGVLGVTDGGICGVYRVVLRLSVHIMLTPIR